MTEDSRALARLRSVRALREIPPEESLRMGFELTEFARKLQEAADRAKL